MYACVKMRCRKGGILRCVSQFLQIRGTEEKQADTKLTSITHSILKPLRKRGDRLKERYWARGLQAGGREGAPGAYFVCVCV